MYNIATTLARRHHSKSQTLHKKVHFQKNKTNKNKRRNVLKTGIPGRGAYLKGWSEQQPTIHERTIMYETCGRPCFLGPNKTFPICTRNTCKRNRKGVYAAYIRAREYKTISGNKSKYLRISSKARKMLKKRI